MPNRTELEKCIFRQTPEGKNQDEKRGYAQQGKEIDYDHKDCLARSFKDGRTGHTIHFLKYATVGPMAGHLWNPHSPEFGSASMVNSVRNLGKEPFEFKKASKAAFDLFLHYLKTGNESYIKQADRETL